MSKLWRSRVGWAVLLWCVLALPPVRRLLESAMTLHMLVQIPLLAVVGWWLAAALPQRLGSRLAAWNLSGVSGLLLASLVAMVWMLPRMLDGAIDLPLIELGKFFSVPLLLGMPLALSWPQAGFVVRGLLLAETVATAFRVGWLYLAAPERLCSNYLLDEQRHFGLALLALGAALVLYLAWKLLWGRMAHADVQGA